MLLIEFEENITDGKNILKYRNIEEDFWYYLYIDIETLNLLVTNFGIISTIRFPTENINLDTPLTRQNINIKYCGAPIELCCRNNKKISLLILEQNY